MRVGVEQSSWGAKSLQRVHHSIIRSIRQQSLVRDWFRTRINKTPLFTDFVPDPRFKDLDDILINRVIPLNDKTALICEVAGWRVDEANGLKIAGRLLSDVFEIKFITSACPVWSRSVSDSVPIYSIMPTCDVDLRPVTLECLALPYCRQSDQSRVLVLSFHAFSTEGRFKLNSLLRQTSERSCAIWSAIIDLEASLPVNLDESYELE